jgi:hypothetical protein
MLLGLTDLLGYSASALTLATFAQRSMLPMRFLAIGANICFIGYGAQGGYMPVLTLHAVLLPINLARLRALTVSKSRSEEMRVSATPGVSSGLL